MAAKKLILGLFASVFAVFLALSFASASVTISPNNFPSGNPGQTVSQSFTMSDTDAQAYTFSLSGSNLPSNWVFSPSTVTVSPSNPASFSASFLIPSNASAGIYPSTIIIATNGSTTENLPVAISVNSVPSLVLTTTQSLTLTQNGSFTVQNTGNVPINNIAFSGSGNFPVVFSSQNINLLPNQVQTINVNISGSFGSSQLTNSVSINATASNPSVTSNTISFSVNKPFCINGNVGTNLSVESDISVHDNGEGSDTDWRPLDDVTVKVTVDNNGPTNLQSVSLVLGLFDSSSGVERTGRLDFINDGDKKIDIGTINDGNSKSGTFEFTVPSDMTEGNYNIVVKAYSRSTGENNLCSDTSGSTTSVDVARESTTSKFIAFNNLQLSSNQYTCGDTATVTFDTVNVGDDQSKIQVHVANSSLGLDQEQTISNGLNFGDSQAMTFSFPIPQGVSNGNYPIRVSADYDYSNGHYNQFDTGIVQNVALGVIGCSGSSSGSSSTNVADISASAQSTATPGSSFTVGATITNLQNTTASFVISPSGYGSWASLQSQSDKVITLTPGQSKDVTFNLNVNSGVSGSQTFTIQATSNGHAVSQDVVVSVGNGSSLGNLFGGNTLIWVIGLVNLVLIILIIVVAVRLSRR